MAKVRKQETEDDLLKDLITEMKKSFPKEQKTITKPELDKKVAQEVKAKKSPRLLPVPEKKIPAPSGKRIPTAPVKTKPIESYESTASADAPQSSVTQGEVIRLETNVDKLYELVKSNGRVSFRQATALFKVPPELVEGWAAILEEHKLVRVHYPALGEGMMYAMEVKEVPKEGEPEKGKEKTKRPKKAVGSKKIVINLAAVGALAVVLLWRFGPPELLNQPVLLGGVGAIVVMMLLLLVVRKRRKQK